MKVLANGETRQIRVSNALLTVIRSTPATLAASDSLMPS